DFTGGALVHMQILMKGQQPSVFITIKTYVVRNAPKPTHANTNHRGWYQENIIKIARIKNATFRILAGQSIKHIKDFLNNFFSLRDFSSISINFSCVTILLHLLQNRNNPDLVIRRL